MPGYISEMLHSQNRYMVLSCAAHQSCGSEFIESGSSILSESGPDPIRIQGFDDQKLKKKIQLQIL